MNDSQIIIAPAIPVAPVTISPHAIALKDAALEGSALIGKVTNAAQNEAAAKAQADLKSVYRLFENSRVKMKEPFLEMGRAIDRAAAAHKDELDKEDGRIAELVSEFKMAERRRIAEEERLQQAELARIEAQKQADLKRIADEAAAIAAAAKAEQDAIERKARDALEAAAKLAAEATSKKQREAAAAAQTAAQAQAAIAETSRLETERAANEAAAVAERQKQAIEAKAGQDAYVESRPVLGTKARGQSEREDWEVEVTNPYDLAKFHPDCVTITPLVGKIKSALNEGRTLQGVKARKILVTNQRAARTITIDV